MTSSLSARLLIAASVSVIAALIATDLVLKYFFEQYFEDRLRSEVGSHLAVLTGHTKLDPAGDIVVSTSLDPRFNEPLSGFYWQISKPGIPPVLSASFWLEPFETPVSEPGTDIVFGTIRTSTGERLMTGSWTVSLLHDGQSQNLQFIVAVDRSHLDTTITHFARNVAISLAVLGAFLVIASWLQVKFGLHPLDTVRKEINRVRGRTDARLTEAFPTELMPLVDEVNDLLDQQDNALKQARARASDLAHGLKTPLTVMQALSRDLEQADQTDIASEMNNQIDTIQHFVERELARTRDYIPKDSWCQAEPVVARLVAAFKRQSHEKNITWVTDVPRDCTVPFDPYALTELLGNLIDNATKWTSDRIQISASGDRISGRIDVADNGPGVDPQSIPEIKKRGGRLDDEAPGQGLGLAIVRDMVNQRNGNLEISNNPDGGLRVTVSWGG